MSFYDFWVASKNREFGPPILEKAKLRTGSSGIWSPSTSVCGPYPIPGIDDNTPAFFLKSVLSSEECQTLIHCMPTDESLGVMLPQEVSMRYRDRLCYRYLTNDEELSSVIFSRISEYLPNSIPGGGTGNLYGISPKWRFLRYDKQGKFGYHIDGREVKRGKEQHNFNINLQVFDQVSGRTSEGHTIESRLTLQLYLNNSEEDFIGGELVFGEESTAGIKDKYTFKPKAGDAVIFLQESQPQFHRQCLHKSNEIEMGQKYCCRAMIEYVCEDDSSTVPGTEPCPRDNGNDDDDSRQGSTR